MLSIKIFLFVSFVFLIVGCENDVNWFGENIDMNTDSTKKKSSEFNTSELNLDITENLLHNTVTILVRSTDGKEYQGSGVFVRNNLVATNFHVIENAAMMGVKLSNSDSLFEAKIFKLDPIHDVAILKLSKSMARNYIKFETSKIKIGTKILVAGTPIGFEGTVSDGIVSSIRKDDIYDFDLIQITAPISHGSSGGPIINMQGKLIGISKSGFDPEIAQNINFAIPTKYIENLLD